MTTVCEHGSLKRQCFICELTEECNQLRARLSEVEKERDEYKTGMEQARGVAARLASGFQILDLNKVFKLVGSAVEKDVRQAIGWAKKEEKAR